MSPDSPARPERFWAHWSSAFASWAATHIPYAVRPRWAEFLRPGHVGVTKGDGEAPNHLAGGTGAPIADTTPGVPSRAEHTTHAPPGIPPDRHTGHPIVRICAKMMCTPSSYGPLLPGGCLPGAARAFRTVFLWTKATPKSRSPQTRCSCALGGRRTLPPSSAPTPTPRCGTDWRRS